MIGILLDVIQTNISSPNPGRTRETKRMIEHIQSTIEQAIPDARVAIVDPQNDGQHFEAYVVSDAFDGLPLVRQHQMVLNSLKNEFAGNVVHAVALKTFTPEKWEANKQNFPFEI